MYAGYGLASPDDFNESPQLIALLADYVQRLLPIGLLSGIEPEFVPVGRIFLAGISVRRSGVLDYCIALRLGLSARSFHGE